jgi:hypothetical protein
MAGISKSGESHPKRPRLEGSLSALQLRSVCMATAALRRLRCHPLPCMLLKLRLIVDSNPIAPTIPALDQLLNFEF